ncbi:MAG: cupin domain-containing protein [Candidatus Eisenbacteria bacterium]|nr:cupin domain-containing protein [Candidatus Latescibacterota bacterium]MBD3302699.1 cupin domain-containing protein [Candidatus Eisenbacteria bacterium]
MAGAPTAEEVIRLLDLRPLPGEGGRFVETYRSPVELPAAVLPGPYRSARSLSTAIYFLHTRGTQSLLHRLPGEEVYHHYLGDPLLLWILHPDGRGERVRLGDDLLGGMRPQAVVPGGAWQGARVEPGGRFGYALIGTTMAPGFSFDDFEIGERAALLAAYPDWAERIGDLTEP